MSQRQPLPSQDKYQTDIGGTPRKKMRRRVRKACEPCRHRRVKCDGGHPCDVCIGYDYNCVYANNEASATVRPSSGAVTSPSTTSQSQRTPSTPPNSRARANLEPRKHLYVLSDDRTSSRNGNTRFTRADSAIAFPRSLGLSLNAETLPRLQAFAWNTGTRIETLETSQVNIFEYITLQELETFSNIYFASVHPIFDMLNQEEFEHRAAHCWTIKSIDGGFQVVVCGVIALGSLFSTNKLFIHEADIIEQARLTLDSTFAHSGVMLSVDFVVGWVLRALYLRSTAGPHLSWMASNMAMHIAESIGLHQEMSEIKITHGPQNQSHVMSEAEIDTRRRTFWVATSLNRLLSAQFGRTMTTLQNITCKYPTRLSDPDDTVDNFVSLMRSLPFLCDATTTGSSSAILGFTDAILLLGSKVVDRLPLILLRADAIFCIYRKLKHIGVALSPTQTEVILSVLHEALDAADSLARQCQQWWTIIGVPFHSICVLIALNTTESLSLLHTAMETLQNITAIFNTYRSREALRIAQDLVKVAEARKRTELECMQRCLNLNTMMINSTSPRFDSSEETSDLPSFEWPTDDDLGFSYFLNTNEVI